MKKVVILNAPPNSGKDVVAAYLIDKYTHLVVHREFKGKLFELTKCIYSVSDAEWDEHYTRELKEVGWDKLGGLSPRKALIYVSEHIIKPNFTKEYFGLALTASLDSGINIITDGGFKEELLPVVESVGAENVLIIQIKRNGCSFVGDSRNYINADDLGVKTIVIENNTTLHDFFKTVEKEIINWLA